MKSKKPDIDIIEYRSMCKRLGYNSRRVSHRFSNKELARLNRVKKRIFLNKNGEADTNIHKTNITMLNNS